VRRFLDVVQQRAVYLWVLFSIPAVSTFGHYLAPNRPFFKGHDLGVLSVLALTVIAALLWIPLRRRSSWPTLALVFLGLLGTAWLYQVTRIQIDGSLFNISAFAMPIILLLIAIKPVSRFELQVGLLVLGYSLVVIAGLSLSLGPTGLVPDSFDSLNSVEDRLGLLRIFGVETRWSGPFGDVNFASPAGALVVVIGLSSRGLNRFVLPIAGILILVLGQSRTATVALILALLVMAVASSTVRSSRFRLQIQIAAVATVVTSVAAYVVMFDPSLNGRTPIWNDFLELFFSEPLIGVGNEAILDFMERDAEQQGFIFHTHGHSVLIDGAARFGFFFAALTVSLYAISLVAGARALPSFGPGPLGLAVFCIAAGAAETIYSWNYWSIYSAVLVFTVLAACVPEDGQWDNCKAEGSSLSFSGAGNTESLTGD